MFCLSDGSSLVFIPDQAEEQTVVRTARPAAPATRGVSPLFKYLTFGLLLLFLFFVFGVTAIWFLWPRRDPDISKNGAQSSPSPVATATPRNLSNVADPTPYRTPVVTNGGPTIVSDQEEKLRQQREAIEKERQRLADERRKLQDERDRVPDTTPVTPAFVDPGTTRITFRRGSVGETVLGTIGSSRSFVLRTLGGQYLSANIRSAGGCVVFTNGATSTGFTTGFGDTYLYLRNSCGGPARFSMTVVVR